MEAWIDGVIRNLLWMLAEVGFLLIDFFYDVLLKIVNIDFVKMDILWKTWGTAMLFISIAIIFRVFMIISRAFTSDEDKDSFDWIDMGVKLLLMTVFIGIFPMGMKIAGNFGSWAVSSAGQIAGVGTNSSPSSIIVSGFANLGKDADSIIEYKYTDIVINEKNASGEYKYFPNTSYILLCACFAILMGVMIAISGANIGKNLFGLAILIVGSFIPISSIMDPKSDMFPTWMKMLGSCYITNFFSILLMMLVMTLSCSATVIAQGVFVQMLLMIAGLLVVLSGVPQIQRLIGGDTGGENTLQQVFYAASMAVGLGKVATGVASQAGSFGGRFSTRAGAEAVYNVGKLMGGKSITDLYNNTTGGASAINTAAYGPSGSSGGGPRTFLDQNEKVRPAKTSGVSLTKPGTVAGKAGTKLLSTIDSWSGVVNLGAKAALWGTSHMYAGSINRIQRGKGRAIR